MKDVRIGFIGTNRRAQGLIRSCKTMPGLAITTLCDKWTAQLDRACETLGDPGVRRYTDHEKMLREAPVDAVYIVVEPDKYPDLVLQSLAAGKHVLSEVPMAYGIEDIWRIVLAVENSGGLKYMLGEQVRYTPFIRKWAELVKDGSLGKIVYAEGQYLHGMGTDRLFQDPETGMLMEVDEALKHPCPKKSRLWDMPHPILYLPHELGPLLRVLDDRVTSVSCMGTNQKQSYVYDFLPLPDFETALMHTEKDTVMRLSCCFTIHHVRKNLTGCHWYHIMGTKGSAETHRSDHDKMKLLLNADQGNEEPEEVWYDWSAQDVPAEALASGHGGSDYWPALYFVDAINRDTQPEMDVYTAAECCAPAAVAALSAERGGELLDVPDFRPNASRAHGQAPM